MTAADVAGRLLELGHGAVFTIEVEPLNREMVLTLEIGETAVRNGIELRALEASKTPRLLVEDAANEVFATMAKVQADRIRP